jgi:hypothetical protein
MIKGKRMQLNDARKNFFLCKKKTQLVWNVLINLTLKNRKNAKSKTGKWLSQKGFKGKDRNENSSIPLQIPQLPPQIFIFFFTPPTTSILRQNTLWKTF